jgi:hypothetical protein
MDNILFRCVVRVVRVVRVVWVSFRFCSAHWDGETSFFVWYVPHRSSSSLARLHFRPTLTLLLYIVFFSAFV